jgi:hypothetical protein
VLRLGLCLGALALAYTARRPVCCWIVLQALQAVSDGEPASCPVVEVQVDGDRIERRRRCADDTYGPEDTTAGGW